LLRNSHNLNKISTFLLDAFAQKPVLSKKELVVVLRQHFPHWADQTVNWNIHKLKEDGILHHVARGMYSLTPVVSFEPQLSNSLKRLHKRIKSEFPFAKFCMWDSRWFNEFMRHQLFRYQVVIEVEEEVVNSAFHAISEFSKGVFLNPNAETYEHYVSNFDEAIIVKPLLSEAPVTEQNGFEIAPLEKLLVDMLTDKNLFAAQQSELDIIFDRAQEKYTLNKAKMKRYASRRNQKDNLKKHLRQL
jgi:hypothetical protein